MEVDKNARDRLLAYNSFSGRSLETADWWSELSPEGQAEYLAEHPDSKKAKEIHQKMKESRENRPSHKSLQDHEEKQTHPNLMKHDPNIKKQLDGVHPDVQKF